MSFEAGFDQPVTIRHVRFANEQTGWAVIDAAASDGTPIALVGPLVHLEVGERARILGEWVTDSRFGRQVKVAEARPLAPDDPETVAGYLRRVKHVGARRAERLIERFGAAEVLDRGRRRSGRRVRRGRAARATGRGSRRVVALDPRHPAAAPAAGPARARLPRRQDPRPLRLRGPRADRGQSLRADERVRSRVRDR